MTGCLTTQPPGWLDPHNSIFWESPGGKDCLEHWTSCWLSLTEQNKRIFSLSTEPAVGRGKEMILGRINGIVKWYNNNFILLTKHMTLQELKILCMLSVTIQCCADNILKCHRLIYTLEEKSGLGYMHQTFGCKLRKINHLSFLFCRLLKMWWLIRMKEWSLIIDWTELHNNALPKGFGKKRCIKLVTPNLKVSKKCL